MKLKPSDEDILAEVLKRQRRKFKLEHYLFKEQLAFVRDPSPFKTGVCSRRSGKTVSCAADLTETVVESKNVTSLYITLSRSNAKKIIWPEVKSINTRHDLGGIPNESELSITYPSGSILYCSGAGDRSEIEKFRGLALKKAYIDESQSFPPYIRDLVDDVISPALMDHAGTLCLIGTPGPVPAGFFYDCSHSSLWSHHSWTFKNNPHILAKSGLTYDEILNRELTRRGVSIEDPSIQREYFARWVLDSDSLVYHYNSKINHFETSPQGEIVYILGIDFGFEDADALAVLGWCENSPTTYLIEEVVVAKQGLTELVGQVEALRKRYDISKIVADFGGLGKKLGEEMIKRYQIPVAAADKARKNESIELMNDALRTGRFKARQDSRFAQDAMLVEWDLDKSTPERKIVSSRFHSDILDAALYAFRESPAYAWTPPPTKTMPNTPKWYQEQADEMEEAAIEHFSKLEGDQGWDF
jgi:hypothetical protein